MGRPLTGLSGRIEQQLREMESMLPVQSQALDMALNQPIVAAPPLDSLPIDANKLAEGRPLAESIDQGVV